MAATASPLNNAARGGLSSFTLKIAAIVGMTFNHACYIFMPYLSPEALTLLFPFGGLTFPIMAFLLVEGYRHTSNIRRYAGRLLAFALVSQVPYGLFLAQQPNVLFTLLLGLAALYLYDHMKQRGAFWAAFVPIVAVSAVCDWGVLGPLMILAMHAIANPRQRIVYALLLPILGTGLPALSTYAATFDPMQLPMVLYPLVGCTATIPLLLFYNGTRGRPMKWFFYAYYPLHILVLGVLKGFLLSDWTPGY